MRKYDTSRYSYTSTSRVTVLSMNSSSRLLLNLPRPISDRCRALSILGRSEIGGDIHGLNGGPILTLERSMGNDDDAQLRTSGVFSAGSIFGIERIHHAV